MQAYLAVVAILGCVCQQATSECPAGPSVPTQYIIGPAIADSCPTGYDCIKIDGAGQCVDHKVASCKDASNNCANWAKTGYCTDPFYEKTRATTCPYTCKLCTASTCVDKSNNCATWIKNSNFCNSANYDLAAKKDNCQKSCNLC
ncbi:unnamed protein product, partial [Mesorhabditis spiculigera]